MFTRKQLTPLDKDTLIDIILALQKQVLSLTERVAELEQRLNKNSGNSSKPPSSDGLAKLKSLRKPSKKKTGGQKGHKGHNLKQVENPDRVVPLSVASCSCGADLTHEPVAGYVNRQVFELPQQKLEVTEYRGEIKRCPECSLSNNAPFPENVNSSTQYGLRFRGLLAYLHNEQLIPSNRISRMVNDLYNAPVSEATVFDASRRSYDNLAPFETAIVKALSESTVLNVDESGVRTNGKLHWLHTASTKTLTFFGIHEKRGTLAMDHFNILPNFSGRLIHDFWKPYLAYDCEHGLCNAHHLRELTFLFEQHNQPWAKNMFDLLLDMNDFVSRQSQQLTPKQKESWIKKYRDLIAEGWNCNPLSDPPRKRRRGRPKKTTSQNLLERLGRHESSVLAFLHDINVPFTNNLAEQDIRMIKVRLKISGCFRTVQGAKYFARIKSYFSTARKQKRNILDSITDAISGYPFIPA
jgi:transposase